MRADSESDREHSTRLHEETRREVASLVAEVDGLRRLLLERESQGQECQESCRGSA